VLAVVGEGGADARAVSLARGARRALIDDDGAVFGDGTIFGDGAIFDDGAVFDDWTVGERVVAAARGHAAVRGVDVGRRHHGRLGLGRDRDLGGGVDARVGGDSERLLAELAATDGGHRDEHGNGTESHGGLS